MNTEILCYGESCSNKPSRERFNKYRDLSLLWNDKRNNESLRSEILKCWIEKIRSDLKVEQERDKVIKQALIDLKDKKYVSSEESGKVNSKIAELEKEKSFLNNSIEYKNNILSEEFESLMKKEVTSVKMFIGSFCIECILKSTKNQRIFKDNNNIIDSDLILFSIEEKSEETIEKVVEEKIEIEQINLIEQKK